MRSGAVVAAGILCSSLVLDACSGAAKPSAEPSHRAASAPQSVPSELARVAGVAVTWLPPDFIVDSADQATTAGGSWAWQDFRGPAGAAPAHRLTLRVDRGTDAPESLPTGPEVVETSTVIRGHDVRVKTTAGHSAEIPGSLYSLEWAERSDVHVTILASFGATLADAKNMAAGLVLH